MQIDWHTRNTETEILTPRLFSSLRPKIWLRRAPAAAHLAIKEYILNRGKAGEAKSLANLRKVLG